MTGHKSRRHCLERGRLEGAWGRGAWSGVLGGQRPDGLTASSLHGLGAALTSLHLGFLTIKWK